jgi:hypothetical protein
MDCGYCGYPVQSGGFGWDVGWIGSRFGGYGYGWMSNRGPGSTDCPNRVLISLTWPPYPPYSHPAKLFKSWFSANTMRALMILKSLLDNIIYNSLYNITLFTALFDLTMSPTWIST